MPAHVDIAFTMNHQRNALTRGPADQSFAPRSQRAVRRVMIIEDEPLVALELELIVSELGHRVIAVVDTESAAVAAASREVPDLIVADVQLRVGNGVSAAERITHGHPIPVIIVSGNVDPTRASSLENVRVLSKPFRVEALRDAIRDALAGR
jgi:CheY-like chemotaxis protein